MAFELTWLGHGSWKIEVAGKTVLLDPFISDNPNAPVGVEDLTADVILVSHGHFDHVADVASIANRCDSTVVAIYEIAQWFSTEHGVQNTIGMNIGGTTPIGDDASPFGRVKMTPAIHSSQLPDGSCGGMPAGFVIQADDRRVYFACDTALFSDMQLIGRGGLDAAVLPIGDLFTMGIQDSVEAVKLLKPQKVLPAHYNTWPPIEQDANVWANLVQQETDAEPVTPKPGETVTI